MKYTKNLILLTALFVASNICHAANKAETASAKQFIEKVIELSDAYDSRLAYMYSDKALIHSVRHYPNGTKRRIKISGKQWKQLIVTSMPLAKATGDKSSYSNIQYFVTGKKVKIKAERYSSSKCYTDKGYYMVIQLQPQGYYLITEEYSENQPQSNC